MLGLKCIDGLTMFAWLCSITQSVPVIPTSGHFFLFWKATSGELLPQIDFLQTKTQNLILAYFKYGLVHVTSENENKMHASKIFYERLNLPLFPSENVLRRDKKKPFFFVRSLLKEVIRTSDAFNKVLLDEKQFRCTSTNDLYPSICTETTDIFKHTENVKKAIHKQLIDFFKHKTVNVVQQPKLYRHIRKLLRKAEVLDEADEQSQKPRRLDDDAVNLDSDLSITYERNRSSVAVLYALYVHLHNTEASLKYALRVLEQSEIFRRLD